MATLKLNIYERQADGTMQLAKTYEAEGVNIMLGTLQDIMAVIDLDRVSEANEIELAKMALRIVGQINPILLDVFPGVTSDELRGVKTSELVPLFVQLAKEAVGTLKPLRQGN